MKKIIVTTTINNITESIEKFDSMIDWEMMVIGDLKTPKGYKLKRGQYISPEDQEKIDPLLSDAIGWNSIQRRNFGLLLAYKAGADIVATIDDDNIPLDNWGKNLYINQDVEVDFYETSEDCFDPIGATNYPNLWHRGFPLQSLAKRNYKTVSRRKIKPSIQADFWNGDPDIDAICRMEHAPDCQFLDKYFPLSGNQFSPFNSQNTFLSRHVIPDYFLFPYIGRMDDIWISYYVQSIGHQVVYGPATVRQDRNEHDLTTDFNKEIIGYQNSLSLIRDLRKNPESIKRYLPGTTIYAWELYKKHLEKFK